MSRIFHSSVIAVALASGWVTPAQASAAKEPSAAEQFASLQAQLNQLNQRVDALEGQLERERARADAAEARATKAAADAEAAKAEAARLAAASKPAEPPVAVAWKGAPELSHKDGWSFKPRGRLHLDGGSVSSPGAFTSPTLGGNLRVRRARLGAEGTMPGGFGYKAELDFANGNVAMADFFLSYSPRKTPLTIRIGNFETLNGLEQVTSSNNISILERASFNDAFLNSRRLGAAVAVKSKSDDLRAEVAVFAAHSMDSSLDNDGWIGAARLVYAPKALGGQLHLGVNYQYREFGSNISGGTSVGSNMPSVNQLARYRARPGTQLTDVRFVDTGNFAAQGDSILGLEGAAIFKGIYFAGEAQWVNTRAYSAGDIATG
ncbi:MAG TPA: porin, partial [Novosphingobium sp.]|nr:porin [Novosphingobium sp.]